MSNKVYETWPPTLQPQEITELIAHVKDWAIAHGLCVRTKSPKPADLDPSLPRLEATHAPIALFPSPFPKEAFEFAYRIQPYFNELVHAMSKDEEFVLEVMSKLSTVDDFMERLLRIWKEVRKEGSTQTLTLGIHRSDYLLHVHDKNEKPILQQVEINTIAASFSSLSALTSNLHNYLLRRTGYFNTSDPTTVDITASGLPKNGGLKGLAEGIHAAWKQYNNSKAQVLFIVQPDERNIYDQRWIEYMLFEEYGVKSIRRALAEVAKRSKLVGELRKLDIDNIEIAVVYFRSGYSPADYISEQDWDARLLVERSHAVKCPSVLYQLVGAKKFQQLLALPGGVERYFPPNSPAAKSLRESFTGIYSLDANDEGDKAAAMAMEQPQKYVMKPQREGGGNNFYGEDIKRELSKMSRSQRSAYILMDRIMPPSMENIMMREGVPVKAQVASELGVYGVWMSRGDEVLVNTAVGHLLRTKSSDSNEGGVAAGFAVIDSPLLV